MKPVYSKGPRGSASLPATSCCALFTILQHQGARHVRCIAGTAGFCSFAGVDVARVDFAQHVLLLTAKASNGLSGAVFAASVVCAYLAR